MEIPKLRRNLRGKNPPLHALPFLQLVFDIPQLAFFDLIQLLVNWIDRGLDFLVNFIGLSEAVESNWPE